MEYVIEKEATGSNPASGPTGDLYLGSQDFKSSALTSVCHAVIVHYLQRIMIYGSFLRQFTFEKRQTL